MKVLMLNGSAKPQGNTYLSLLEVGKELEKLGYSAWYEPGYDDEPGRWYYEIPSTYGLKTIPQLKPMEC